MKIGLLELVVILVAPLIVMLITMFVLVLVFFTRRTTAVGKDHTRAEDRVLPHLQPQAGRGTELLRRVRCFHQTRSAASASRPRDASVVTSRMAGADWLIATSTAVSLLRAARSGAAPPYRGRALERRQCRNRNMTAAAAATRPGQPPTDLRRTLAGPRSHHLTCSPQPIWWRR